MQRNVTLSLCAATLMVALMVPSQAATQEGRDTVRAADVTWAPAVAKDGAIRWGAAREEAVAEQPAATERRAVPNIFQVIAVEGHGSFIVLEDGSRWEVFLPHRPGTAAWQPGDHVLIQLAPVRRGNHTYRMQNGERDDVAAVRFAGMAPAVAEPGLPPTPPRP